MTERGGRPVLAVRAERARRVPGIVHDTGNSGQTLFVEPFAIVELSEPRCASSRATSATRSRASWPSSRAHVGATPAELAARRRRRSPSSTSRSPAARSRSGWRGCPIEPADDVELVAARHPLLDPRDGRADRPAARGRPRARAQRAEHGRQDRRAEDARARARCCTSAGCTSPAERAAPAGLRATCSPTSATSSRSRRRLSTFSGHLRNLVHDPRGRRRRARSCCSTRSPPAPIRSRAPRSPGRCSTSSRSARR